jgi:ABC-2 type transport system ATP-binding protein
MKQKLALSCALVHTPRLLILDEPTTGVDPVSRGEFWEILFELRRQGITLLVSTPYMDEAAFCDALVLLHKGEILRQGSPAELLKGYPHRLFRITAAEGGLSVRQDAPLPGGVALLYPASGALHAAVSDPAVGPEALLDGIKKIAPGATAVHETRPGIEDLLFVLLSGREAA